MLNIVRMVGSLVIPTLLVLPLPAAEPIRFNRDIRPILADACFSCHGPGMQKAKLRLDVESSATKPRGTKEPAFVPGKPGASTAIHRIESTNADEKMPPADSHKTLTASQIATLKQWVTEGAKYEPHWSFATLSKPLIPSVPRPAGSNVIDAFLAARMAKSGLTANREADRATLIRRVSFALTGLPPSPQEVAAYFNDPQSDAYERMVDRYLAKPQYGEEMARHWLDLARYADTHGLHLDNERSIWPYRDWVVRSFNRNQPFDQFTIEQLAGDLLPDPTRDQLIATGFNRCNVTTGEGGSIDAEWYFRNAVDRAAVAAETWLGLTAGCAQCHDHKFDPITQKDFYSLYAFYYSAAGPPLDSNTLLHEPFLKLSTPEQEKQLADWNRRLAAQDAAIAAATARYVEPLIAIAFAGPAAGKDAADLSLSFKAWVAARGGPDAAKLPKEIATIFAGLTTPEQQPNVAQNRQLRSYFLRSVCPTTDAVLDPLVKAREAAAASRTALDQSIPGTMIYRDAPTPRQSFVMLRGQYDKTGDKVDPDTPSFLAPLAKNGKRPTRLDLARWIVAKENGLTPRVYVNRLWQQFFGIGVSKTANDLGTQGEVPVHPELLDWLAVHFRDNGWDIKATVRLMLTSAAFRRSAKVTPEMLRVDPENRLLLRGPRFRLDAEQVRDNALYVSGLLNPAIGGKGVKPYQPEKIWEPVAFTGSNTQFYKRDDGPALYRRSLYTFFKRTAPPPFLSNFDAPNREQPCSRRDRSNTPLQALQLMNDIQHVEAARAFAERLIAEGGKTDAERITFAFRLILTREPTAEETTILSQALAAHRTRFTATPADAQKLIAMGETKAKPGYKPDELAAMTLVASTILNLDETLTRN
jgi:hypothetical protein